MKLFDVYSLFDVTPIKAKDVYVYDDAGNEYLDLYGGHAVISVGYSHPHYVENIKSQLDKISFYSNSVKTPYNPFLLKKSMSMPISKIISFFFVVVGQNQ